MRLVATGSSWGLCHGAKISLRKNSLHGATFSSVPCSLAYCSHCEMASITWSMPEPSEETLSNSAMYSEKPNLSARLIFSASRSHSSRAVVAESAFNAFELPSMNVIWRSNGSLCLVAYERERVCGDHPLNRRGLILPVIQARMAVVYVIRSSSFSRDVRSSSAENHWARAG